MFPPGGQLSVFPNSEEKFQQLLFNMHRMFSNYSLDIDIGMYLYGNNPAGGLSFFHRSQYCGSNSAIRKPLYWYSDANQAARFNAWDYSTCNQSYYNGVTPYITCAEGLNVPPIWGSGSTNAVANDRCSYFGDDCTYQQRQTYFSSDTDDSGSNTPGSTPWFSQTNICGGNSCFKDAFCDPIFASFNDYIGTGFVENSNAVVSVFSRFTKEITYPLPIGMLSY